MELDSCRIVFHLYILKIGCGCLEHGSRGDEIASEPKGLKAGGGAQVLGCFVGGNCGLNTVEEST